MRALVTGSAGFLGRHFVAELTRRGHQVEGIDVKVNLDALDFFAYRHGCFDLVVHCAAVSPNRLGIDTKPASLVKNQLLDAAMFDYAVATRPERVIYLSSCAALDLAPDDYGLLKLTGERLADEARRCGVPVTVVRPYSGYGEDQSEEFPFRAFIERARRREDPFTIWGDGRQLRDWIHVDDVVGGALHVAESGTTEPISLCTGLGRDMQQVARWICDEAGYHPTYRFLADKPAGAPARIGNPEPLQRLGYTAKVSLGQGIRRALEYAG